MGFSTTYSIIKKLPSRIEPLSAKAGPEPDSLFSLRQVELRGIVFDWFCFVKTDGPGREKNGVAIERFKWKDLGSEDKEILCTWVCWVNGDWTGGERSAWHLVLFIVAGDCTAL